MKDNQHVDGGIRGEATCDSAAEPREPAVDIPSPDNPAETDAAVNHSADSRPGSNKKVIVWAVVTVAVLLVVGALGNVARVQDDEPTTVGQLLLEHSFQQLPYDRQVRLCALASTQADALAEAMAENYPAYGFTADDVRWVAENVC